MPHRSCLTAGAALAACAAALTCTTRGAQAGSFADDGTWLPAPDAVFVQSFEGADPGAHAVDDASALGGSRALHAQASYVGVDVPLTLPSWPGIWLASAWCRSDCVAGLYVDATEGDPGDFSGMFPTGRMTSDGWIEMVSAPFASGGSSSGSAAIFFYGSDLVVDAIEVTPASGVTWEPPRSCSGVTDPGCDDDHVCLLGWCRDPSGWVPPMPDGSGREQLADYLASRLRFFFAPYFNRLYRLPAALAELEGMSSATSRWQFWRSFSTALHRLQDSHTIVFSLADLEIENTKPLNACFILGDGDLSHAAHPSDPQWPDVLVSHAGNQSNWGLRPGDRLVAIDGKHPVAWLKSLTSRVLLAKDADDPTSLSANAEWLRNAIPRYAGTITVLHCEGSSCATREDIAVASIPEVPSGTEIDAVACDHRPGALVAGQPQNHVYELNAVSGQVIGSQASEKLYGLVWDDLVVQTPGAAQITQAVQQWRADARGVILDHRTGDGGAGAPGTTASAEPIVDFVRTPTFFGVDVFRRAADEEAPETVAQALDLVAKYENTELAWYGGDASARTDVPVALMISRDVSFSDLFAYAMKGAPHVRIFGPHATNGAYSTFLGLGYATGLNFQLTIADVMSADGQSLCGHGTEPDEVVLPQQSDLVAGRDTTILRALEWVRSEVTP